MPMLEALEQMQNLAPKWGSLRLIVDDCSSHVGTPRQATVCISGSLRLGSPHAMQHVSVHRRLFEAAEPQKSFKAPPTLIVPPPMSYSEELHISTPPATEPQLSQQQSPCAQVQQWLDEMEAGLSFGSLSSRAKQRQCNSRTDSPQDLSPALPGDQACRHQHLF